MYGKFFSSTFTGSMYGAGVEVFAVWGYVIANAINSRVELNPQMLASVLGSTTDKIEAAITYLCNPDAKSRSPDAGGRRLVREGQFQYLVTNHETYRSIRNEEDRREYNRIKQRESRARHAVKTPVIDNSRMSTMSAHTEAEAEADTEATHKSVSSVPIDTVVGKSQAISTTTSPAKEKNNIPYTEIVSLYHETLPELPKVAKLTKQRQGYIRQRWLEDLPDMNSWRDYFIVVRKSKFLMGKANGSGGRPPFRADLTWLCRPENIVKVIEGKYHG